MNIKKKNIIMIIAIVVLSAAVITLSVLMGVYISKHNKSKTQLNNTYERSYYELLDDINNIEVNLSKAIISSGKMQKQLLFTISTLSEAASSRLCCLPLEGNTMSELSRFMNQMSGFSQSLLKKEKLEEKDIDMLGKVYKSAKIISEDLHSLAAFIGREYSFSDNYLNKDLQNPLSDLMSGLNEQTVQYPELIYDGPFATAKDKGELKGLDYMEVSKKQCEDIISKYFAGASISKLEFSGEMVSGGIECYSYNVTANNVSLYVQLSKKGGKLLLMDAYKEGGNKSLSKEQAISSAESFLSRIDIENVTAVWYQDSGNDATINFAAVMGDVILYPDLIKVKVDLSDGSILGVESINYYTNHTAREFDVPSQDIKNIKYEVSKKLENVTERLALIPKGKHEILAFEITGEHNGLTFFIYIDAKTGEEVDIFRVIDTEQGSLVI